MSVHHFEPVAGNRLRCSICRETMIRPEPSGRRRQPRDLTAVVPVYFERRRADREKERDE